MIDFNKQNKINEEVYHSSSPLIQLCKTDIEKLIQIAKKTDRNRARFCSHSNSSEVIQEMFIVHPKNAYVRPHKHLEKPESLLVLHGSVQYFLFDEEGNIEERVSMSDCLSGKTFYYSTREPKYHSMLIQSEWLVFLEITKGPFVREESQFAPWSPVDGDLNEVNQFMKKLELYEIKK